MGGRRPTNARETCLALADAAAQVQLVGMQAQWLNGAQGMIEGVKDPATARFTVRVMRFAAMKNCNALLQQQIATLCCNNKL